MLTFLEAKVGICKREKRKNERSKEGSKERLISSLQWLTLSVSVVVCCKWCRLSPVFKYSVSDSSFFITDSGGGLFQFLSNQLMQFMVWTENYSFIRQFCLLFFF